jgi:hypothetical protein
MTHTLHVSEMCTDVVLLVLDLERRENGTPDDH